MPGGFDMVFKEVHVPDKSYLLRKGFKWSESYMRQQDWYYFLGKYEVTIAQYLAVMGDGDLEKGFKNYFLRGNWYGDSKLKSKLQTYFQENKKRQLYQLLARPINALEWLDIQVFIDQYNRWCLNSTRCINKLSQLTGSNNMPYAVDIMR
jgi:formylglycine-generating enzyme required for sulfatase activity